MDILKSIFLYNEENPMIFTQLSFWVFFAVLLFGYTFLANRKTSRSLYIFLVSLFFYYKSSGLFFLLLIFNTFINYFFGNLIYNSKTKRAGKIYLVLIIFINLLILSYFKYASFFTGAINEMLGTNFIVRNYLADFFNLFSGHHFDTSKILLPVGISFYTFQTMSYIFDVYNKKINPVTNILDFGFYVSFFPTLVAGPIIRASEFIPQIYKKYQLTNYDFGLAIFMILKGLIKKIMIGDYIAVNFVDRVFANPDMFSGFENIMAIIGYSLQVYVDFSGYTDIATGLALFMGFKIAQNFNSPYKARNCSEFWKRWHISLSNWLKDYLYVPLGGNRNATAGTYLNFFLILFVFILLAANTWFTVGVIAFVAILLLISKISPSIKRNITTNMNLMITMLIGGLWHGASWNFLIWGGLNGLGILAYKYWRKISPWENKNGRLATIWKIALTFGFITFTRVFFRAPEYSTAETMLNRIWNNFNLQIIPEVICSYYKVWIVLLIGFILHWLSYNFKDKYRDKFIELPHWGKAIITVIVIFIIYQSVCAEAVPFIYFQF